MSRSASIASTTSETSTVPSTLTLTENTSTTSALTAQLDDSTFGAERYVNDLLRKSSLQEILKVEATLVSEIRNLDGERKALVYDNYSKLIKAVGTIGDMQRSMNEDGRGLTEVGKLESQIEGLRKTVRELADDGNDAHAERGERVSRINSQRSRKQLVRWVLDAPERLRKMLDDRRGDDAAKEWAVVRGHLLQWTGVSGVAELKETCEEIMSSSNTEAGDDEAAT